MITQYITGGEGRPSSEAQAKDDVHQGDTDLSWREDRWVATLPALLILFYVLVTDTINSSTYYRVCVYTQASADTGETTVKKKEKKILDKLYHMYYICPP